MATAAGVTMIRYMGTEPLRLEDEGGQLRGYFSVGAQLAIGDHNRELAEELLERDDFEIVNGEQDGQDGEDVTAGPLTTETAKDWVPGAAETDALEDARVEDGEGQEGME